MTADISPSKFSMLIGGDKFLSNLLLVGSSEEGEQLQAKVQHIISITVKALNFLI